MSLFKVRQLVMLNGYRWGKFSIEGVARIVPFLVLFNKLTKVFVGGRQVREGLLKKKHHQRYLLTNSTDQRKFDALLEALGGAFETRALSLDLDIDVIESYSSLHHDREPIESMRDCQICRNICWTFPIKFVMWSV